MDSMQAFAMGEANRGKPLRVFDWDKAEQILADLDWPDASAGLAGDLEWTAGSIVENGKPTWSGYTYLASTWATPVLIIHDDEIPCWRMQSETPGWDAKTKWPGRDPSEVTRG